MGDHALIDGDFKLNFENRSISISSLFVSSYFLSAVCLVLRRAEHGPGMDIFQLGPGRDKLLLLPWDHCLLQTRYFNTITRPGHPGHWRSTLLKWIGQKGPKNKRQCEKC